MNNEEKNKIIGILAATAELYGRNLSADTISLWIRSLEKYSFENVRDAFNFITETENFFPVPAKIHAFIKERIDPHVPQIESTANVQAAYILKMIRENGYRHEPQWEDPTTRTLMRTRWKWVSLCETSTEDNEVWFVKEFIEAYLSCGDVHHDDFKLLEGGSEEVLKIANNLFKRI